MDEVIDQLQSANNPESDYNGGYFGVTYDVNRLHDATGHFYLDHMGGTEIYHDERLNDPAVKKFPEIINTENYPTPPQSPKKGGKRRKKKTRKKRGGKRRMKKTRKKRGGELKDLSAEELKAALDRSLSYHIHLFGQLVEADREFNYKFRHPNWKPGEPSVEEQLLGKYEDWRYDQMMEHKGIWTDYGDEMGQYIANAPIDELNGTMDFYCENWKSALGERLKNCIFNFK